MLISQCHLKPSNITVTHAWSRQHTPTKVQPTAWHVRRDDITIARSAQGKKMRIGEGGTGTVYKALMHSCDEVAVKVVRTAQPTLEEASDFHKVCTWLRWACHGQGQSCCAAERYGL